MTASKPLFDEIDFIILNGFLISVVIGSGLGLGFSYTHTLEYAQQFAITFIGVFSMYFALYAGMRYFRPATWKAAGYK